jgi:hypothetical protein
VGSAPAGPCGNNKRKSEARSASTTVGPLHPPTAAYPSACSHAWISARRAESDLYSAARREPSWQKALRFSALFLLLWAWQHPFAWHEYDGQL